MIEGVIIVVPRVKGKLKHIEKGSRKIKGNPNVVKIADPREQGGQPKGKIKLQGRRGL